jgi:uncharacterized membrane protein
MKRVERTDLGRIVAFTDGVMAVAITLLVLNIEVPDVDGAELDEEMVDLLPSLAAYLLSFALVGRFWIVHHAMFERLRAFDGTLMALNLVFLAAICLIPFASELFDQYDSEPIAAAVFGGVLGVASFVNWYMHLHTLGSGLVKEVHRGETAEFASPVAFGITALFLISVPAAFVTPTLAQALWISTIVLRYPLRRLTGRASSS